MTEFQFLKSIFYTLKRTFPQRVNLINKTEHEIDIITGKITEVTEERQVRRAVVLHRNEASLIQRIFGNNASVRVAERYVLVDAKDIRNFNVSKATIVEHNGEYWSIVEMDDHAGVIHYFALGRITGDVGPDTPEPLDTGPFEVEV